MSESVRYCGRDFSEDDLTVIRNYTKTLPNRQQISYAVCDALCWYRPDGRKKDMSARVALLRMERDGLITLPPARPTNFNVPIPRFTEPIPEL